MLEQTGQPTMVFIHKTEKKTRKLRILCKCGLTVYFLVKRFILCLRLQVHQFIAMFDLRLASIQVSISSDKCLRSLLALLFNRDLSSRDHSITQCCLRFYSLNEVCTHSLHLERKRLNSDLHI